LPIAASYVAKSVDVPTSQRVDVIDGSEGLSAVLQSTLSPSSPPARDLP
jgi:hypothetical protein